MSTVEPPPMATPRVAAGALVLRDSAVLLVRPTYKEYWDIPGGYAEPGESPKAACQREIHEELGLTASNLELAAIDWAPNDKEGDKILFLFADRTLHGMDVDTLVFPDHELSEARYIELNQLEQYTIPRLVRRLTETTNALLSGHIPLYLEHGSIPNRG
ncbi:MULTISPECIES: NUDIX hydrolase [unclassified Nocardia]|uniref:NUDIX domain-containing protein n=1 Tax=unclassified Nocardia TaxID=2637762 RepID=UPI001CE428CD|nr:MULTISPECIES: NUDIX hydrolase [unclassified Nocardia]